MGSWSGRGNVQTETFTSDTGAFRVTWETRNETSPGAGRLYAVFRSGDSGREIMDAVKAEGVGRGVEHVAAERPRWYYLSIESASVDWAITVDEQIPGQATKLRLKTDESSVTERTFVVETLFEGPAKRGLKQLLRPTRRKFVSSATVWP